MERACLSSSAQGLHRKITVKSTDFRARFSGMHRLSIPQIAHRGAKNTFQVFASLDNDNLAEGSCSFSGRLSGGDPSTSEPLTVVNDQSVLDGERGPLTLEEFLYEIDEKEMSGAEDDTSSPSSLGNGTWFQAHFVKVVRPIVQFLSGTYLNKSLSVKDEKYEWQDDDISWSLMRLLNGSLPPEYHRRKIGKRLRQIEADFFLLTSHVGRFILIMMATGAILATGFQLAGGNSELETLIWYSWLAGIISGSMIGAEKVMEKRVRSGPRNVVITGSTRGLGKALAREFLISGDRVVIASRSPESVAETVEELQKEIESKLYLPSERMGDTDSPSIRASHHGSRVIGMACDVSKVADVRALADFAAAKLGSIDIWVNNAGVSKGFRPLVQFSDDDIRQIVQANLIGSLLCTREAIRVMKLQPKGGHVFNMDGAGSGGSSTPLTAVYGATKCGLRQLHTSILKECKRSRVGVHTASPGMVLTDLLLSGASLQNKKMFNIICELPETVARNLVPRMREIRGTGKAINFLTPPRILLALITAWLRRGRWFDEEGRAVYAAEADRLRNWAEGRTRFPAMDQFPESTYISVFSITVVCAFIMLSTAGSGMPGT
ncbi:hypothetical protein GOP47_0017342 [Adiantum capillus-veneris]|uniref:chlorophyll(ide) b reductase n=1 Tax=Adiantum capillus-veneris TaxID=13818 RepID=A0A9D4UF59_ADICA|nr:hypothetical protein GOP47_0017342 [Adiantum capillus-veneris]